MVAPENPSAGNFGPPSENAQRERERLRTAGASKTLKALIPAILMGGIFVLRSLSHSRRGWGAVLTGFLLVAGYGAQYIFSRQQQDRDGEADPYTPPTNITR